MGLEGKVFLVGSSVSGMIMTITTTPITAYKPVITVATALSSCG